MCIFQPTFQKFISEISNSERLFICSPWIAPSCARSLVNSLDRKCELEIWLRMAPGEFDKQEIESVLHELKNYSKIRLGINRNLHWKAYLTPFKGFIGSANFTRRGLPVTIDDESSIEGLLLLTRKQLCSAWDFKKELANQIHFFQDIESAMHYWDRIAIPRIARQYPDDGIQPHPGDTVWPEIPMDFMR